MTLLHMNTQELMQQLENELASNPALDVEEQRRCPSCRKKLGAAEVCPVCSLPRDEKTDEPVVFLSPLKDLYHDNGGKRVSNELDDASEDDFNVQEEDFASYVLKQVNADLVGVERQIAEFLVNNLDDNGLLAVPLTEISRYFHVPPGVVERVKAMLQRCEPFGVCSSSSIEAIQVQMEMLEDVQEVPELVKKVVDEGLDLLYRRQLGELCDLLEVEEEDLIEVIHYIAENFNPYPSHSHFGSMRTPTQSEVSVYHQPDAIIRYLNDDPGSTLMVEVMMPYIYRPFLNNVFKQAMLQMSEEQKEEWQKDYGRAVLLVKCLQQRAFTMLRLMQFLVKHQSEFILKGDKFLKPITRASVAALLEVHESTVSRAVANKSAQLPNGKIIPLSTFFSRNTNVRTVLKELINNEEKPLSDSMLVKELQRYGFDIARRTVAKYRSMEGILPAHLRKASRKYHGVSSA